MDFYNLVGISESQTIPPPFKIKNNIQAPTFILFKHNLLGKTFILRTM